MLEDDTGNDNYEMTAEEEETEAKTVERLIVEEQHNIPDAITEEELKDLCIDTQEYSRGDSGTDGAYDHCGDCSDED
jgi:hypothetical protein